MAVSTTRQAEPLGARLLRGAAGGLLSGTVFAAVAMWYADSTGGNAGVPLQMISTLVRGSEALLRGTGSAGMGLAIHAALSVLYGALFGLAVPRFRTNGTVAIAGTLYGGLLFVVNFVYLAPLAFYAFAKANYPFELFAHLVYGMLLSFAFFGSGVRRGEPVVALQPRPPRQVRHQPLPDRAVRAPDGQRRPSPPTP
ncbi:MAG TPA: hypothetical protein VE776_15805 [Actinomycetota bacterium]|jgi:hypothetical protein|nr:hypothetical protein [Actinomycetota bacterium]